MGRASHRDKLLTAGLRVVHERGLASASVRDIVAAAGVPQGSFTNHFRSKEDFGLAVLERYYKLLHGHLEKTLFNERRAPLERLRSYIDGLIRLLEEGWIRKGCILGNFSAELTDENETILRRVAEIYDEIEDAIKACLRDAVRKGDLPRRTNVDELARFINSSQQGATLVCKARRSTEPMRRFKRVLFGTVLKV
jgi:TetR/AcrR family transcriptional repressor of nem operon